MRMKLLSFVKGIYFTTCLIPYVSAVSLYTLFFRAEVTHGRSSYPIHYKLTNVLLDLMFIVVIPNVIIGIFLVYKIKPASQMLKVLHYLNFIGLLIVIYIIYFDKFHAFSWFVD